MIEDFTKYYSDYETAHPVDIARAFCKIADHTEDSETDGGIYQDILEVCYILQTYAQNNYNPDFWRVFYNVLTIIANKEGF